MKEEINSKLLVNLITRLSNLCEGFDVDSKCVLIDSKLKILLVISENDGISPSVLKNKVGIAKGNLAVFCKKMLAEDLIFQTKDEFDARVIFYHLTEKGKDFLNNSLNKIKYNFENELAYKGELYNINETIKKLQELIN